MKPPFDTLRLPVFAAPMFLISGPELVIAACRAGVAGAFPTPNCRTIEDLDQWMDRIVSARLPGDAPWIANMITHSTNTRLSEDLRLIAQYKPPVVITALGSPRPVMETVKSYGGLVFADVVSMKLARKAAEAGVDGLACVSAGAGGHTGHLSPFAFISAVRDFFDGYVAVGGGVGDGAGVAGAVAAGADFVYMGTRFLATQESLAQDDYKQMVVQSGPDDLVVSPAITGTAASWLRPSLIAAGLDPDNLGGPVDRNYTSGGNQKRWKDLWAAGQGIDAVRRIEPVSQVVEQLTQEYRAASQRFNALALSPA
ncbi:MULTISPECIES: NAD(P)H-dependent flavin oxidoreductase [unclassified Brevundimonas]|uniref:NAD(P)H-dependent flavin oxidoreductase n=1 Tax=unclassified Brevundimonas TaxID=2622653 RepID=UPI002004BD4A|nr:MULTISPECIES: nitronate monooxygenase [unclassified Brevundimonas]MCK6103601.1 nitronate monooxygenase [Brevundimonas sp. EYE_349]